MAVFTVLGAIHFSIFVWCLHFQFSLCHAVPAFRKDVCGVIFLCGSDGVLDTRTELFCVNHEYSLAFSQKIWLAAVFNAASHRLIYSSLRYGGG